MGEIHAKACNCDLIGCFCHAKVVIVRDWIILADDDSITFDFRPLSSIFYVSFTCFFSLMLYDSVNHVFSVFGWFKRYFEFTDRTYHVCRPILNERHRILLINSMKYALSFICFKSFWRGMPDSRMLSFWSLHWVLDM